MKSFSSNYLNGVVYCECKNGYDIFTLKDSKNSHHYLFMCRKSKSVEKFFEGGRHCKDIISNTNARRNYKICKVIDRLPSALKYVNQYYNHAA